jgi:D-alanyl-D-alanine carboxypeptidase
MFVTSTAKEQQQAQTTNPWLESALVYIDMWIEFHMRLSDQPGCTIAIAQGQDVIHERSFGVADLDTGEKLTERHRFRVASHSKTFTAVGILKLREQGCLRLDDSAGSFVDDIHPSVAAVTLNELLTHGGGLSRDGEDAGFFSNQRPFLSAAELAAALKRPSTIEAGQRPKYSNLGYGLLGLVIENITRESYGPWMMREIIGPAGLHETTPDVGAGDDVPLARGHTARLPLANRRVIFGDQETFGLSPATGYVSTAADLARFYAQLSLNATSSILSTESRRDMTRPIRPDPDAPVARSFGFGVLCGEIGTWNHFGHLGRFPGFISRTVVLPAIDISVVVLTNAIDGPAPLWLDGVVHILRIFHEQGAPEADAGEWTGRWWSLWGAMDLVAVGSVIKLFSPLVHPPFTGASDISLIERDRGRVTKAPAAERFGEAVFRLRDRQGVVTSVRIGGQEFVSEAAIQSSLQPRQGRGRGPMRSSTVTG